MDESPDDRSALAIAVAWASTIMVVAALMVVPGILGYWLDQRLGTIVLFTMIGFAGGVVLGIRQLIAITRKRKG